ncbi:hypothetical protein HDIA_0331 [Hartmannibacter diazotrophicus]|uniref:YCII-related domain-containing protein n=1 Tax=Hartmannibacter diazotrophicus TaxID=1482074 RepID=A0A2C9D0M2_9HYPH|nr:hypothetical protein [Hartmannibacter diazotrophicus]SON53872.1 hypothetical protein HDIA_0331 [Hartmannibacter diazotrophicus]
MFLILLRFSANKADAPNLMEGHNAWIKQGFDDGVFLLTGSLKPGLGGSVVAHNATLEELHARVALDPFVAGNVVSAEILEIAPAKTDPRLAFLAA